MEIADSAIDLIGNTPMVRLNAVTEGAKCPIVAKLEFTNPGGSAKDRPALWMINNAEAKGLLKPGGTIVEPTSGNTGVGLAIVASQRGYKCVFVMTDKVAPEKVDLLRAYGAEVVVCPVAVPPEDPESYYSVAERLVNEIPGAYRPNQYDNPSNPEAHYATVRAQVERSAAWLDISRNRIQIFRSSLRTPRGRSIAGDPAARTWWKASVKISGHRPMTRLSSIVWSPLATLTRSLWHAECPKKKAC